jgi:hypothetical protein
MKLTLKLSEKQLSAIVFSFNEMPQRPAKDRIGKVTKSVLDKVALKLRKRHLEVKAESNLFNKDKKYSISLELVDAHFLEQFISIMDAFPMCDYDRNALRQIASTLNQKLA